MFETLVFKVKPMPFAIQPSIFLLKGGDNLI
jgi:hypothetical protein